MNMHKVIANYFVEINKNMMEIWLSFLYETRSFPSQFHSRFRYSIMLLIMYYILSIKLVFLYSKFYAVLDIVT